MPFIGDAQDGQTRRDRKEISGCLGWGFAEKWGVPANGYGFLWGAVMKMLENRLQPRLCNSAAILNHRVVHFGRANGARAQRVSETRL